MRPGQSSQRGEDILWVAQVNGHHKPGQSIVGAVHIGCTQSDTELTGASLSKGGDTASALWSPLADVSGLASTPRQVLVGWPGLREFPF